MQTARNALVNNAQTELYNTLRYHMVNKRFLTKDMKNDMTLLSMYNKQGLHINHYSNGVCIKINNLQRAQYVVLSFRCHVRDYSEIREISCFIVNAILPVIKNNAAFFSFLLF